ncbi:conserved hypothetical protein, partial [Ricinus communis]
DPGNDRQHAGRASRIDHLLRRQAAGRRPDRIPPRHRHHHRPPRHGAPRRRLLLPRLMQVPRRLLEFVQLALYQLIPGLRPARSRLRLLHRRCRNRPAYRHHLP